MKIYSKNHYFCLSICLISLIFFAIFFKTTSLSETKEPGLVLDLAEISELVIFQENTLIPLSNPANPEPAVKKTIRVMVTAYSSTPWQTWGDPYITAAGTGVREGIVANNMWPIGTKVRFPEVYGDKIFVVEDRMNSRKGPYHFDIWFPSYWEALNFGAKTTYVEVLES